MLSHVSGERPAHKPIRLRNRTCIYCGVECGKAVHGTDEHVIARRFVPRGTLDGQWNLIARACETCNHEKSQLEDDIAAISMQPDVFGRFACDDSRLASEAPRKAQNSFSRRTRGAVKDSAETLTLTSSFGPATATFDLLTGPQVDSERLFLLARYHIEAFYYLITYNEDARTGSSIPGVFAPLIDTRRGDWGNALMVGFTSEIRSWHHRVCGVSADGFFKVLIRRHPERMVDAWAWAVEWNQNIRVIGFFGDEQKVVALAGALPKLVVREIPQPPNVVYRYRNEVPLPEDEDYLFVLAPAIEDAPAERARV